MFPALRIVWVIFLAMLQLIAPLAHAHAGDNAKASGGLHIPGLEMYSPNQMQGLSVTADDRFSGDMLVMVDSGIRQNIGLGNQCDQNVQPFLPAGHKPLALAINLQCSLHGLAPPPSKLLIAYHCAPRAPPAN